MSDRGLLGVLELSTAMGTVAVASGVSSSQDIWDSEDESESFGRGVTAGGRGAGVRERVPAAGPMRGGSSSLGFRFLFGVLGLA